MEHTARPVRAMKVSTLLATAFVVFGATACSSSSGSTSATTSGATSPTTTAATTAAAPSCDLVSAEKVNAALGTTVGAPTSVVNGSVTVCTYKQSIGEVIVRFDTASSPSAFAAGKAGMTAHSEPVTAISGFGDEAYTSTIGTGTYATNTIVVRKGSTELLITGPASLPQVEALASQVVPQM